jgi:hypothetical protein
MNGGPPPAAARTRSSAPHGIPPTNQIKVELTNNTPGRPTARPARPPPARRPSRPARPAGRPAGPGLDRPSLCFWLGLFLARERFCLARGWYPAHRGRAASPSLVSAHRTRCKGLAQRHRCDFLSRNGYGSTRCRNPIAPGRIRLNPAEKLNPVEIESGRIRSDPVESGKRGEAGAPPPGKGGERVESCPPSGKVGTWPNKHFGIPLNIISSPENGYPLKFRPDAQNACPMTARKNGYGPEHNGQTTKTKPGTLSGSKP